MNILDEVVVLPKPTGPAALSQTTDDLYSNRVAVVCGFTAGSERSRLVRIKFSDGRFPRDAIWMPRARLRPYEPPFTVRLERKTRAVLRDWKRRVAV